MEPFNIRIQTITKDTTLTILPAANGADFKVIYNGAVIGAVNKQNTEWKALADDELQAGDLPLYEIKYGEKNTDFAWDSSTIKQIGSEIDKQPQLNLKD